MKIEHVAIWCKDLEEMRDFYETYFLGEANDLYENKDKGLSSYFLKFPNSDCRLELMTRIDIEKFHKENRFGLAHLAFQLETKHAVDELTELIKNGGYKHLNEPRLTGDGYYESKILDPEGNIIEITASITDLK